MSENISGLTLRDWFAAMASQEDLDLVIGETRGQLCEFMGVASKNYAEDLVIKAYAKARYIVADAMIKARENTPSKGV